MMPLLPYQVLDQNAFTRPHLLNGAIEWARRTGGQLVVTDVAMIEITKPDHWEQNISGALRRVAQVPDLMSIGRGVPELLRIEFASGLPAWAELVDRDLTPSFCAVLKDIARGQEGPALRNFVDSTPSARQAVAAQYVNGDKQRAKISRWVSAIKGVWPLATPDDFRLNRSALLGSAALAEVFDQSLETLSPPLAPPGARLGWQPSVFRHECLGQCSLALKWLSDGGLDSVSAKRALNDAMDLDYAIVASACAGFVSEDGNARSLYESICAASVPAEVK